MTAPGRLPAWRRRGILFALALVSALVTVPATWLDAPAQDSELTVLFHGSVGGKIAPCG